MQLTLARNFRKWNSGICRKQLGSRLNRTWKLSSIISRLSNFATRFPDPFLNPKTLKKPTTVKEIDNFSHALYTPSNIFRVAITFGPLFFPPLHFALMQKLCSFLRGFCKEKETKRRVWLFENLYSKIRKCLKKSFSTIEQHSRASTAVSRTTT